MLNRFGLEVNSDRNLKDDAKLPQFSVPENDDGAIMLPAGPDTNFTYQIALDMQVSSESELINQYRQISLYTEPDLAVQEIVNEAIVQDDENPSVELNLDNIDNKDLPAATKKEIKEEFENVLAMLKFDEKGVDHFQRWYIDSRIVFQKLVDPKNTKKGIQKLKFLDPRKIRKIKEVEQTVEPDGTYRYTVLDEYFLYFESANQYDKTYGGATNLTLDRLNAESFRGNAALKINKDSIAYVTSGLTDPSTGVTYGYLHKAIRPFNQLRWSEDSMVINRVANSGQTRIIYVDTGRMNPKTASSYMAQLQQQYKNKLSYDAVTGNVKSDSRVMSVQENIWLPRIEGGRSTEIDTLQSSVSFSDIADIEFWKEKLYHSLRVPPGRFKSEGIQMVLGQQTEVSREELKFTKFINKIRKQFAHLFSDILKTQVILKGILTEDEWDEIADQIDYNFIKDSYYTEAKEQELLSSRLEALAAAEPIIGKFISYDYARRKILRQTDEEMKREDELIEEEKKMDKYKEEGDEDDTEEGGAGSYGEPEPEPDEPNPNEFVHNIKISTDQNDDKKKAKEE